jgi:hypothetical protein
VLFPDVQHLLLNCHRAASRQSMSPCDSKEESNRALEVNSSPRATGTMRMLVWYGRSKRKSYRVEQKKQSIEANAMIGTSSLSWRIDGIDHQDRWHRWHSPWCMEPWKQWRKQPSEGLSTRIAAASQKDSRHEKSSDMHEDRMGHY